MKRKIFLSIAAIATLMAVSCSKSEEILYPSEGGLFTASFNVNCGTGLQTRAISDGLSANKLYYEVYDAEGKFIEAIGQQSADVSNLKANVSLSLAKGQSYSVVFWAQYEDAEHTSPYDLTQGLNSIKVNYEGVNNDEKRDAFFGVEEIAVDGIASYNVTLNRPFAQINIGSSAEDWAAAVASGITIEQSTVKVTGACDQFNALDGTVSYQEGTSASTVITYSAETVPSEVLTVSDNTYKYLSMSYILASDEGETVGLEYTFIPEAGGEITLSNGLGSTPVKRNYRTNIVGNILSSKQDFNVEIDPAFSEPDYAVELFYAESVEEAVAAVKDGNSNIVITKMEPNAASESGYGNDVIRLDFTTVPDPESQEETPALPEDLTISINEIPEYPIEIIVPTAEAEGGEPASSEIKTIKFEVPTEGENDFLDKLIINAPGVTFTVNGKVSEVTVQAVSDHTFIISAGSEVTKLIVEKGNVKLEGDAKLGEFVNNSGAVIYLIASSQATLPEGWTIPSIQGNGTIIVAVSLAQAEAIANGTLIMNNAGIEAAVNAGKTTLTLEPGTYQIPANIAKDKTLKFIGAGETAEDVIIECNGQNSYNLKNSVLITFENLTIKTDNTQYIGYQHVNKLVFNNCIISEKLTLYGENEFSGCTFNITASDYNIWSWGTNKATFSNCEFNNNGKAVLVYGGCKADVTFNTCVFNDNGGINGKAAVETGDDYHTAEYTININNCQINGYDVNSVSNSNIWGNKNSITADNLHVFIDGTQVY